MVRSHEAATALPYMLAWLFVEQGTGALSTCSLPMLACMKNRALLPSLHAARFDLDVFQGYIGVTSLQGPIPQPWVLART